MVEKKVIIMGGGLAGLVASIHLTRLGVACKVFEKRSYPFHRVCGEYISNEVAPYLTSLGIYPKELRPSHIRRFQLTSVNGKTASLPLDLGGFGISRHQFDYFLYRQAAKLGVEFHLNTEVEKITFSDDHFMIKTNSEVHDADLVIGSFGKRSKLDVDLHRSFIQLRSPYVGVKYHIRMQNFPDDLIALHNFKNGYCGISRVEDDVINLCYLSHRDNLKTHGSIPAMEKAVLHRNPFLESIFKGAEFLFDKPEVINEISFETKGPLAHHILMTGDAAGMITPLCGNGMAIAIHSSKLLSEHVLHFCSNKNYSREQLEKDYAKSWKVHFAGRLWAGRQIQKLFGSEWTSNAAVAMANRTKPLANYLIRKTHGTSFDLSLPVGDV